jgi:16S rRNA G966 N2-methylase RsmD
MPLIDIANRDREQYIDRSYGLQNVVSFIQSNDTIETVLDLFAGDGSYCSFILYNNFNNTLHIEKDPKLFNELELKFGSDRVLNTDTYKYIKNYKGEKFDFVFCDNGMWEKEYFNIIPHIKKLLNPGGYFVHNINVKPYGKFSNKSKWGKERSKFYNVKDTSDMDYETVMHKTAKRLKEADAGVKWGVPIERELYNGHVYLHFLVWKLDEGNDTPA